MKRSATVVVGKVMIAGMVFAMSGCATGPDYVEVEADSQEICVDRSTGERVDFDKCDDDRSHGHAHFYPWYHSSIYGPAPAVGSKISPAHGASVRPATGSIARPPSSGGFGVTRVTSSGS